MVSRSAITKVKALFIIDVIIVAVAAGSYLYLHSTGGLAVVTSKPAEFTVTDLAVQPLEAGLGEPITISVNVTNVGGEEGSYSLNLTVNDLFKGNQTVLLFGGNSSIVGFTDAENAEGNYVVKIGGLSGTFTITNLPPPPALSISNLVANPYEGWANETITISAEASNTGKEAISYPVPFRVDNVIVGTEMVQLSAGETTTVEANVTESSEGTHSVNVLGLQGSFAIVPTGEHTLEVLLSGGSYYGGYSMSFTLDGVAYTTPYSELLPVGTYTLSVLQSVQTKTAVMGFNQWSDGDTSATITVNLQSRMVITASYKVISGIPSCPSLSIWNGTNYVYRAEVSAGTGYLGNFEYFREDGTLQFGLAYPWDYVKLDSSQLQPRNGYYDMILDQLSDEIFYIDAAKLIAVDHPANVDVYSTQGSATYVLDNEGEIYAVSKNLLTPVSAINGSGENVLPQISKLDGIYTTGQPFQWNTLELNLGNLTGAKEIKLVVAGWINWPSDQESAEWLAKFVNQPGVWPFPLQYMEVKDKTGNWVRVADSREFPYLNGNEFVVNLTGLFPTNDYSLRINYFGDWRFDYIGVDTSPQQNVIIQEISPAHADLIQEFLINSTSTGNFTRYGDVTPLLLQADDEFVIGRGGDEVHILFPDDLGPVPKGMVRDYFLFVSCYFKTGPDHPYMSFTVDPLPFNGMSCFPYPSTESYPYDAGHLSYISEYNTRIIK